MQQRHKEPGAASRMQEGIQQAREADLRAGGREASSWDFHRVTGSEWMDSGRIGLLRNKRRYVKSTAFGKDVGGTTGPACTLSGNR
jgi:hypothetical protein